MERRNASVIGGGDPATMAGMMRTLTFHPLPSPKGEERGEGYQICSVTATFLHPLISEALRNDNESLICNKKSRIQTVPMKRPFSLSQPSLPGEVWSAAPTPFTARMEIDTASVRRMVAHHIRLGVKGLFICGTNGEGPWLTDVQRRRLLRAVIRYTRGRVRVAVQVTDNSAARVLDNITQAHGAGAEIAVIAPPYFIRNASGRNILRIYQDIIRRSSLPVGIYDLGKSSAVFVPNEVLRDIYAEPEVIMIKDSSKMPDRMRIALEAKRRKPFLCLLNGWEFNCIPYIKAGYDGLLLGGGVFNGYMALRIIDAVRTGNLRLAAQIQARMNRMMWAVYGGRKITCWLAGEKYLLMRMGIFKSWQNYPHYPLTPSCRRGIERTLQQNREWLFP